MSGRGLAIMREPRLKLLCSISRSAVVSTKTKLDGASAKLSLFLLFLCTGVSAQQTVFNVPSGDVLGRGKVYGELDLTYRPTNASGTLTPRIVVGVGHRIETGLNVSGLDAPGSVRTTPTPTVKSKIYDGGSNGWAILLGDDVFLPAQDRAYAVGNYIYAQFTKTWKTKSRATLGAFDFTRHVIASGNRAGGQFAIEQPVGSRVTAACDWFTGRHAVGYITPGIVLKVTRQLTWYSSYQIGNAGVASGNHQVLFEVGWNFN